MSSDARTLALLGGRPACVHPAPRYPIYSEQAQQRVAALLRDGPIVGYGKLDANIAEAENALAEWHGTTHCLTTSSGHGALHSALIGLQITDGAEVITTPFTWGVSVSPILHNGAIPVFADVDPETGLLDPDSVEQNIGDRTRAILVTHIFGQPADLTRLRQIAYRHGLALIEDGSQAHGARHAGVRVGAFGDAAGFSCMGLKLLATTEAGYMLTDRKDVYWNAVISGQHAGSADCPGRSDEPGFPSDLRPFADSLLYTYRISTINAILLVEQLKKLDRENAGRAQNRTRLRELLVGVENVAFPDYPAPAEPVFYFVSMNFVPEKAGITKATYLQALVAEGVSAVEYISTPLHKLPRLDPNTSAPRVMWTAALQDAASRRPPSEPLSGCDHKVARSIELPWHYVEPSEEAMRSIADAFVKVEDQLDALREYERSRHEAVA